MRIRLVYGAYSHELGEASVVINRQSLLTDAGIPYAWLTRWDVSGTLKATSQSLLGTAIQNLVNAYSINGQNAYLQFEDTSNTVHQLLSVNAVGGVRVVKPPEFPIGEGAEYSLYRNYSLSLEAEEEVFYGGGIWPSDMLSWEETVEIIGTGGPRKAVIEVLNGLAQEQVLTSASAVYAIQRGSAIGRASFPFIPPPLWPAAEQGAERHVVRTSPKARGYGGTRTYREYKVEWSYSFLANIPLTAFPTTQPTV